MRPKDHPENELTSWKEIAEYFQSNVRTVQHWEKDRGLPVHRMPGKRGRVWASVAELQEWKRSAPQNTASAPGNGKSPSGSLSWLVLTCITLALIAGTTVVHFALNRPGPPSLYRVEQNTIVVSDQNGKERWRRSLDGLDMRLYEGAGRESMAWFGDLEADGKGEVLFAQHVRNQETSGSLWCFTEDGAVKWRFLVGRAVSTSEESFGPVFTVGSFLVKSMGKNRPNSIVVVAFNSPDYPTQVALLSAKGNLVREYWHSGFIGSQGNIQVADLNNDGTNEIYLAGVNNGYKQATLVVLDPDSFSGASREESAHYQLQGFTLGRESARILFPRSCIARKLDAYNSAISLRMRPEGPVIEVDEQPGSGVSLFYHLSNELKVGWVGVSDRFRNEHRQMQMNDRLDHGLTDEEVAGFRNIRLFSSQQTAASSSDVGLTTGRGGS